jgi:hypothetical protein
MTAEELKQGIVDTFLRIADRFGVPCVILALVFYSGREAAIAIHVSLVEPVVKTHVKFVEQTSETLREISGVQTRQAATLEELAHGQRELRDRVRTVNVQAGEPAPKN